MPDQFGALTPEELGLGGPPAPAAPVAPAPGINAFLPKPGLAGKIAPLAVMATALLGGKGMNGLAQGFTQGQRAVDADNLHRAQLMQQDAVRQQAMQQQAQMRAEAIEAQRQKVLLSATEAIKKQMAGVKDSKTYDQQIDAYAAMLQQSGFRVTPNQLRMQAPFIAPSAKQIAGDAVSAWLKNPANAAAMRKDPNIVSKAMIRIDTNGDGIPENVPLLRAGELGGIQFAADEKGNAIPVESKAGDPKIGSAFQEVYKANYARFLADNKREPDPKEKQKLVSDSIKGAKEKSGGTDEALADLRKELLRAQIDATKERTAEAEAKTAEAKRATEAKASNAVSDRAAVHDLAAELLKDPALGGAVGMVQGRLPSLRSGSLEFENKVARLKALLSVENRQKLKGQGTVSDFESRMLERAATSLDARTDEAAFRRELQRIIDNSRPQGGTASPDDAIIAARKKARGG